MPFKTAPKHVKILDIKVDSTSEESLLTEIAKKLASKRKFYIVTPNPEIILQAQKDKKLASILNRADFSLPDGVGLKFASPSLKIIHGRKFLLRLLELANTLKLKVFFFGAGSFEPTSLTKALKVIQRKFPNIILEGNPGPLFNEEGEPIFANDFEDEEEVVKKINSFKPDLVFVGLGAPKQEKWIARWLPKLNVKGMVTVGGALDYLSGSAKLPPSWMEKLELEWLWRLFNEPWRARRIVNAVIVFPFKLLLSKF